MADRIRTTVGRGHRERLPVCPMFLRPVRTEPRRMSTEPRRAAVDPVARLRRPGDVRAVIRAGAKAVGPAAVVHARWRGDGGPSRVTVVAGRRLGTAVTRNRAKRRLRAAIREAPVGPEFDIVLVARPGALTLAYPALCRALAATVGRATSRAEVSR